MIEQIFELVDKNQASLGFDHEGIIISSKSYDQFEQLKNSTVKKGLIEIVTQITIADLEKIEYNQEEANLYLSYTNANGKVKKQNLTFHDPDERENFANELGALKNFTTSTKQEATQKPLLWNVLGLLTIVFVTYGLHMIASGAQNGENYQPTGRKRVIGQLIIEGLSILGPNGVLICGGLGFVYLSYNAWKRYSNPAQVITLAYD